METIEKIELYLEGNLNAEESVLFEQEIQTNPELQAEIDTYRDIISGIRLGGEKDFMKIIHQWEKEIVAKEVNNETETGGTTADQKVIPLAAPKKSGMKWIVRIASAAFSRRGG